MTDDLRTREEALHRLARAASLVDSTHHFGALADAFTAGYLAHADQQPTREQLARALMMVRGSYLLTEGGEPSPMPGDYRCADAVLALLNGDDDDAPF